MHGKDFFVDAQGGVGVYAKISEEALAIQIECDCVFCFFHSPLRSDMYNSTALSSLCGLVFSSSFSSPRSC